MKKVILHSDLNNFYASVECLYNPEIRDKPVAVCGSQSTRHGIVLAKNYHAKEYGVKTGEAVWESRKKCPGLVVVPPNYSLYLKFSCLAVEIYRRYTDMIEPFGIDECWLDVTASTKLYGSGEKIAHEIRKAVFECLGVTASVGVSYNKIFAKLASDMKKPNAVTVITPDNFKQKVWSLPVQELLYVGRSTLKKLNNSAIMTIGDLARAPRNFLVNILGKWGEALWVFANGFDTTQVSKFNDAPPIKGIGNSLTTPRDLTCNNDAKLLFYVLAESVGQRLRKHCLKGKTVQISIRADDLSFIERQAKLNEHTCSTLLIAQKAFEIFQKHWNWSKNIRLLGVRATDLVPMNEYIQQALFPEYTDEKKVLLDKSIDNIRSRFGYYSVQRALFLKDKNLNANPAEENVIHPVSFFKAST